LRKKQLNCNLLFEIWQLHHDCFISSVLLKKTNNIMKCWILFALPIFVACLYIAIMFYIYPWILLSLLFIIMSKFFCLYVGRNFMNKLLFWTWITL
jgi:hypothetical protein